MNDRYSGSEETMAEIITLLYGENFDQLVGGLKLVKMLSELQTAAMNDPEIGQEYFVHHHLPNFLIEFWTIGNRLGKKMEEDRGQSASDWV